MDNATVFFLREEVEKLRKKGESWDLSNEEIDKAILRALGENTPTSYMKDSKVKNNCFRCFFHVMLAIFSFCLLLWCGMSVLSSTHPGVVLYIGQMTADLQYPLQRMVRLLSLPIHQYVDISGMNSWECMVNNPLYTPEDPDCEICQQVKKVASRSSTTLTKSAFKKHFYDTGFPVVIRNVSGYGDKDHSFAKFEAFYNAHQEDLEEDACEFYSNGVVNESASSLKDFLDSWDHYHPSGNITAWKVCYGKGLRALRALFPRPYCIHSEGALDKSIYLLQPASPLSDVTTDPQLYSESARGSFDNVWVAQVTGSTSISLFPVEDCGQHCEKFEFTLNQGDVFFFSQNAWVTTFRNAASEPAMVFTSSYA